MLKTLRLRFVVINMCIVTVMLCIIFGMVYRFTSQNLESQSLSLLRSVSNSPVLPMRPGEGNVSLPYFSIRQENGRWVADFGSFFDLSDESYLQELTQMVEADDREVGVLESYGLRYLRSFTPRGEQITFADISGEQDTLHRLIETCSIIGALSFAVFLGISLLLARWAVKPVDQAWQQQKQFVADASHELKTPLTVIQTSTELLRQTEDPAERSRFEGSVLEMSGRMRQLIEGMLTLARSDNGQILQSQEAVNLSHLVSDAILPFEPIFFETGLSLSGEQIHPNIRVVGDALQLRRLIDILLDNARKYSLPGGETTISLLQSGKSVHLTVSNPASPVTPAQCREIFRRFYRMDDSRSGESFGLGLSIAECIIRQHGGRIRAAYQGGVFSIHAELPLI